MISPVIAIERPRIKYIPREMPGELASAHMGSNIASSNPMFGYPLKNMIGSFLP